MERVQGLDSVDETRRLRAVRVHAVQEISRSMRRLTLGGDDLATLRVGKPCEWAKIFLPLSAGDVQQVGRAYTLRGQHPERNEVDIDVVIHDEGPLSNWARDAVVGDEAFLAGPRGGYSPDPQSTWFLLAADASALPAMASILEALPPGIPVHGFVLAENFEDLQLLPPQHRHACSWTESGEDHLLKMIKAANLPSSVGEVWAAGEAGLVRALRKHFLLERKLSKAHVHCAGYWKRGSQDHRDSSAV